MEKNSTKALCVKALLTAMVTLSTMFIQLPVSATSGYIHLGDSMILIAGIFFGRRYGFIAGGLGSALADVLSGYSNWALFTFIIKGFMGFAAGSIADYTKNPKKFVSLRNVSAALVCEIIMVSGYFLAGAFMYGSFAVALTSVPENLIQAAGGLIIFAVVGVALSKINLYKYISIR